VSNFYLMFTRPLLEKLAMRREVAEALAKGTETLMGTQRGGREAVNKHLFGLIKTHPVNEKVIRQVQEARRASRPGVDPLAGHAKDNSHSYRPGERFSREDILSAVAHKASPEAFGEWRNRTYSKADLGISRAQRKADRLYGLVDEARQFRR
jgi:hypothetical protein